MRKQTGSAGNKTRRYHERPNETSNTEVKETMKVAITAKRVVILMMTMALAVALVACSGAVGKPGEPGGTGPAGPPGEPPEPINLAPIARTPTFDAVMLREDGEARDINVATNFVDPEEQTLELTHSVDPTDGVVTVERANGVLTVTPEAAGEAVITVTATDPGGKRAFATLNVTVEDAGAPIYIGSLTGTALTFGGQHVITGADIKSSFEGEDLSFEAGGNDNTIVLVTKADDDTVTITALAKVGKDVVTITATDEDGETVSHSIEISVVASLAPQASDMTPDPVTLTAGGGSEVIDDVSIYFSDPAGGDLDYDADSSDDTVATADAVGSMVTIMPVAEGPAKVTVTATNSHGSATQTIRVTVNSAPVAPNNPPTLTPGRTPPQVSLVLEDDPSEMLNVDRYFEDADRDALTYRADSSDPSKAMASVSGSIVTITAVAVGPATITVTAFDDEDSVDLEINVTVDPAPVPQPQNMAPRLKAGMKIGPFVGEPNQLAGGTAIDLDMYFTDPDGSNALLAYKVTQDETKEVPDTAGQEVIHISGGTTTPTCTDIDADGSGMTALPDGTDFDSMLWICLKNPGTAEVEIVAIDAADESDPVTVKITVLETGSIMPPVADPVVTGATDDAYNPITVVDGVTDATTRLQIGKPVKVIENRAIELYFSDDDFDDDDPDMLMFTVKHFAAGTFTAGPILQAVLEEETAITDSTKHQVMASFSQTTWDGDGRDKFTLTLTPQNAGTDAQQIALIATDMYGLSAARVFDVRVNHKPKAEGAQEPPLMLSDAIKFNDNTPFLSIPGTATETTYTLTIVVANGGYFSDGDGLADLADAVGNAATGRWCEASRSFTGEKAPATVSVDRPRNGVIDLTVVTPAELVYGSMTISVRCRDAADEWSGTGTLQIEVKDLKGGSIQ